MPKPALPAPEVNDAQALDVIDAGANVGNIDIITLFLQADFVVQGVLVVLLISSLWSWMIVFDKWPRLSKMDRKMRRFERNIWSGDSLERHYEKLSKRANDPLSRMFVAGMFEWMTSSPKDRNRDETAISTDKDGNHHIKVGIRERIMQAMDSVRYQEIAKLESHLGFLATAGSTAPFIGLFGTVWGIMHSFQAIAETQNTTLAVVAPGIAEALFATAVGLFVAIPAVIFYNKFANKIGNFSDRMDSFIHEFNAVISRELEDE